MIRVPIIETALVVALTAVAVVAAGEALAEQRKRAASSMLSPISIVTPSLWRDPDNGCEYLVIGGSGDVYMTPRLQPDGRQVCLR